MKFAKNGQIQLTPDCPFFLLVAHPPIPLVEHRPSCNAARFCHFEEQRLICLVEALPGLRFFINRLHQKILKSAGLEHIRLHDLRHTFATVALQNGVDIKTVSSMLGHFDAGFTLRTYTHVTTKMQEEAAATMGKLIGASM